MGFLTHLLHTVGAESTAKAVQLTISHRPATVRYNEIRIGHQVAFAQCTVNAYDLLAFTFNFVCVKNAKRLFQSGHLLFAFLHTLAV